MLRPWLVARRPAAKLISKAWPGSQPPVSQNKETRLGEHPQGSHSRFAHARGSRPAAARRRGGPELSEPADHGDHSKGLAVASSGACPIWRSA